MIYFSHHKSIALLYRLDLNYNLKISLAHFLVWLAMHSVCVNRSVTSADTDLKQTKGYAPISRYKHLSDSITAT